MHESSLLYWSRTLLDNLEKNVELVVDGESLA